jgi:hypothetical protein
MYRRAEQTEEEMKAIYFQQGPLTDFEEVIWLELKALHRVTQLWPAPNDVASHSEVDFRRIGTTTSLPYYTLLAAAVHLFVTGNDHGNGTFGRVDISSTECWISNASVTQCDRRGINCHTRLGIAGLKSVSASHIAYGVRCAITMQMWQYILCIYKICGFWVAPNDIDEKHERRFGLLGPGPSVKFGNSHEELNNRKTPDV